MPFYAIQARSGQELKIADRIAEKDHDFIDAILVPDRMDAYLIVEAPEAEVVRRVIGDIPAVNKMLPGEMSFTEVKSFLSPKSKIEGVHEGELVEIIDGPYKGDRARVQQINHDKDQLTVELHEAPIPIPVAINGDQFRVAE